MVNTSQTDTLMREVMEGNPLAIVLAFIILASLLGLMILKGRQEKAEAAQAAGQRKKLRWPRDAARGHAAGDDRPPYPVRPPGS